MGINILIPIGLTILFPLLLWLGGRLMVAPGRRFKVTSIFILIVWTMICLILLNERGSTWAWSWLAGCLFISTSFLLSFMLWSVLCWGYTLSMLLCLAENTTVASQGEWEQLYAGPEGIECLSLNRAKVLVRLRFANIIDNNLILTNCGRFFAYILYYVRSLFGIST